MDDPHDRESAWTDREVTIYRPNAEPEHAPANLMLTPLWDARPLEKDSWGSILGFDDGSSSGDFIDMRLWLHAEAKLMNELPRYQPAHAPLPLGFRDGGVRRCYRPTENDLKQVRALYPELEHSVFPPWMRIEAALVLAGHDSSALAGLSPPALLGLLVKSKFEGDGTDRTHSSDSGNPTRRKRRGRPRHDPKRDEQIWHAYENGGYRTNAECDRSLGLDPGTTKRARDRYRKRRLKKT